MARRGDRASMREGPLSALFRRTDAEELFEQMLDTAGPTGLLPEQYDPLAERGLGNHPQAYSHLGLIRCALLLDQPEPKN